ncbi:MAG: extracellular solute-binding protein [Candidatus Andersenbacteria bacterium]
MIRHRLLVGSFLLLCVVALSGFGCRQDIRSEDSPTGTLVVWGLWQESEDIRPIVDAFKQQTGIDVEYKKIASVANYERELLAALASGRGPDVFVIHHTWVEGKLDLLTPAPAEVIDPRSVQEEFVDVVAQDVVRNNRVYALPTSVDTLALFYNKDIFNASSIPKPPATWTELQQVVEKITKVNRVGSIEQSAVALGTAANINRAADILQLLMLQSGLNFDDAEAGPQIAGDVGERALIFYTDFANKAKKVYTWDLQQDFSIDAFAEGDTAMMFNYSYHVPTVKAKNSRLNFGLAPVPQIAGSSANNTISFAAYWPFGVSNSTPTPTLAWQFVRFLTNKEASLVLNKAQQVPPARKDSVVDLQRDPILGVFTDQTLNARSWVRSDIAASDAIFNTMIDSVVTGTAAPAEALRRAEDQLKQLRQ